MKVRVAAFAMLLPALAAAHGFNPALLRLQELGPGRYDVTWKAATSGEGTPPPSNLRPHFPAACRTDASDIVWDAQLSRFTLDCGPAGLVGQRISFTGLASARVDALVALIDMSGRPATWVARVDSPNITIAEPVTRTEPPRVDRSFLSLGVMHILTGYDTLLFLLGIVLLVGAPTALLKTLAAFTVAYSLTLTLAILGFARLPQRPVEACVAVSILLLATELARPTSASLTRRRPWLMAFAFGLPYGFAFAAALSSAGLTPTRVPTALLSFNLGVEVGQLVVVATALAALGAVRRAAPLSMPAVVRTATYVIGSWAAFWCLDRMAAFFA